MTVTYFTYPWNMLPEGSVKDVMSEAYDFADTNINETIAFVNRLLGKEKTIKQMTYQVDYSDDVTVIEDKTRDIVIELPEAISEEPIELSILAVDDDEAMAIGDMPEGVDHIEAYEVTLGDMHLLPGVASLSIPYKSKKVPDEADVSQYISAMYFDETSEQWTYTYYTIDEKDELVTIKTPHFSTFAITYGDTHRANRQVTSEDQTQIINQLRLDAESGKPNEAGAMALAWTELNNYMGLGTQGSGFYAETMESMKFLTSANFTSLNNALTNYGYGVAIINTVKDMMTAETDAEMPKRPMMPLGIWSALGQVCLPVA